MFGGLWLEGHAWWVTDSLREGTTLTCGQITVIGNADREASLCYLCFQWSQILSLQISSDYLSSMNALLENRIYPDRVYLRCRWWQWVGDHVVAGVWCSAKCPITGALLIQHRVFIFHLNVMMWASVCSCGPKVMERRRGSGNKTRKVKWKTPR